jgi:hypothetical protein
MFMKNWKDTLSSVCGLVIVICGAIAGLGAGGAIVLPLWLTTICGAMVAVAGGLIGWLTGKNPNLTQKSTEQISNANTGK